MHSYNKQLQDRKDFLDFLVTIQNRRRNVASHSHAKEKKMKSCTRSDVAHNLRSDHSHRSSVREDGEDCDAPRFSTNRKVFFMDYKPKFDCETFDTYSYKTTENMIRRLRELAGPSSRRGTEPAALLKRLSALNQTVEENRRESETVRDSLKLKDYQTCNHRRLNRSMEEQNRVDQGEVLAKATSSTTERKTMTEVCSNIDVSSSGHHSTINTKKEATYVKQDQEPIISISELKEESDIVDSNSANKSKLVTTLEDSKPLYTIERMADTDYPTTSDETPTKQSSRPLYVYCTDLPTPTASIVSVSTPEVLGKEPQVFSLKSNGGASSDSDIVDINSANEYKRVTTLEDTKLLYTIKKIRDTAAKDYPTTGADTPTKQSTESLYIYCTDLPIPTESIVSVSSQEQLGKRPKVFSLDLNGGAPSVDSNSASQSNSVTTLEDSKLLYTIKKICCTTAKECSTTSSASPTKQSTRSLYVYCTDLPIATESIVSVSSQEELGNRLNVFSSESNEEAPSDMDIVDSDSDEESKHGEPPYTIQTIEDTAAEESVCADGLDLLLAAKPIVNVLSSEEKHWTESSPSVNMKTVHSSSEKLPKPSILDDNDALTSTENLALSYLTDNNITTTFPKSGSNLHASNRKRRENAFLKEGRNGSGDAASQTCKAEGLLSDDAHHSVVPRTSHRTTEMLYTSSKQPEDIYVKMHSESPRYKIGFQAPREKNLPESVRLAAELIDDHNPPIESNLNASRYNLTSASLDAMDLTKDCREALNTLESDTSILQTKESTGAEHLVKPKENGYQNVRSNPSITRVPLKPNNMEPLITTTTTQTSDTFFSKLDVADAHQPSTNNCPSIEESQTSMANSNQTSEVKVNPEAAENKGELCLKIIHLQSNPSVVTLQNKKRKIKQTSESDLIERQSKPLCGKENDLKLKIVGLSSTPYVAKPKTTSCKPEDLNTRIISSSSTNSAHTKGIDSIDQQQKEECKVADAKTPSSTFASTTGVKETEAQRLSTVPRRVAGVTEVESKPCELDGSDCFQLTPKTDKVQNVSEVILPEPETESAIKGDKDSLHSEITIKSDPIVLQVENVVGGDSPFSFDQISEENTLLTLNSLPGAEAKEIKEELIDLSANDSLEITPPLPCSINQTYNRIIRKRHRDGTFGASKKLKFLLPSTGSHCQSTNVESCEEVILVEANGQSNTLPNLTKREELMSSEYKVHTIEDYMKKHFCGNELSYATCSELPHVTTEMAASEETTLPLRRKAIVSFEVNRERSSQVHTTTVTSQETPKQIKNPTAVRNYDVYDIATVDDDIDTPATMESRPCSKKQKTKRKLGKTSAPKHRHVEDVITLQEIQIEDLITFCKNPFIIFIEMRNFVKPTVIKQCQKLEFMGIVRQHFVPYLHGMFTFAPFFKKFSANLCRYLKTRCITNYMHSNFMEGLSKQVSGVLGNIPLTHFALFFGAVVRLFPVNEMSGLVQDFHKNAVCCQKAVMENYDARHRRPNSESQQGYGVQSIIPRTPHYYFYQQLVAPHGGSSVVYGQHPPAANHQTNLFPHVQPTPLNTIQEYFGNNLIANNTGTIEARCQPNNFRSPQGTNSPSVTEPSYRSQDLLIAPQANNQDPYRCNYPTYMDPQDFPNREPTLLASSDEIQTRNMQQRQPDLNNNRTNPQSCNELVQTFPLYCQQTSHQQCDQQQVDVANQVVRGRPAQQVSHLSSTLQRPTGVADSDKRLELARKRLAQHAYSTSSTTPNLGQPQQFHQPPPRAPNLEMPITTHSPTTTTLKTVSDLRHPQMPLSAPSSTAVKTYPIYQPQAIRPPSSLPEAPNHWVVPHGERSSGDGPTQTRILHSVLAKPRSLLKSREAEIGQHCLQKVNPKPTKSGCQPDQSSGSNTNLQSAVPLGASSATTFQQTFAIPINSSTEVIDAEQFFNDRDPIDYQNSGRNSKTSDKKSKVLQENKKTSDVYESGTKRKKLIQVKSLKTLCEAEPQL